MSISSLQAEVARKKSEKTKYEKRKKTMGVVLKNIDDNLDDEISSVNKQIGACADELQVAITGYYRISTVVNEINQSKEKSNSADSNISTCRANVQSEFQRCTTKIAALEAEIRSLQSQIEAERKALLEKPLPIP